MDTNCIFPDDLVEDILSRLPVKDLLQVRCVCKRWCALIDDVSFIKKHYQVQYSSRRLDDNMTYIVDHLDPWELKFQLLSIQQGDAFPVDLSADLKRDSNAVLPYGADQYIIRCRGCVSGIICVTFEILKTSMANDSFVALWNPATRECKTFTYPNDLPLIHFRRLLIHGLGFDQSLSDFKILGEYSYRKEPTDKISYYQVIYSLKSNSWKWISPPLAHNTCGLPLTVSDSYLNGVWYWVTDLHQKSGCPLNLVIVSFDFTAEVFKVSDLPHDAISLVLESAPHDKTIALYKECLALAMSFKVPDEALYNIHIWVATRLDDCGVPLSWQHLFNIGPLFTIGSIPAKLGISVRTVLMNGDLQLESVYGESSIDYEGCLYNHSTGEFKKFDVGWLNWFRYVESLFPLSKRLVQT